MTLVTSSSSRTLTYPIRYSSVRIRSFLSSQPTRRTSFHATMESGTKSTSSLTQSPSVPSPYKPIDCHLQKSEATDKYPYHPGQEPTLDGSLDFLLQCMDEAEVDGALIVQPINHILL